MTSYRSTTADTKLGYFARGAHHPDIINTVALGGGIDYQSSLHRNTLPRNKHDTSFQSAINASGGLDFSYPYHYNRLPIGSHAIGIQNAVDGNSGDLKQSTISGLTMVNSGTWKNTYRVDVNAAKSNFGGASNIGLTPGEWYTLDCVINDQTASGGGSGVAPGFWDVANSGFLADFYSGAGSLLFYHSGTYITSTALGANTVNDGRWHRITLKMCYLGSGVIRHVAFADGVKVADFNYTYPFLGPVLPGFSSGAAGYMYIQPGWDFSIHGDQPVMSSNFANQQSSMLPTVSNFIFNYTFDTSNVMTWSIYGYPTTGSAPTFIYPDGSTVTAVATSGTYDTGASSQAVWALIYWNLKTNSWNIQFQISPFSIAQVATAFGDGLVAMLARFGSNAMVAGRSGTSGTGSIGGGKQGIAFN